MVMSAKDLILAFCHGAVTGSANGGRLKIDGDILKNYGTPIAYRTKQGVILNGDRYSPTTLKHQNHLRQSGYVYKEVTEKELLSIIIKCEFGIVL